MPGNPGGVNVREDAFSLAGAERLHNGLLWTRVLSQLISVKVDDLRALEGDDFSILHPPPAQSTPD